MASPIKLLILAVILLFNCSICSSPFATGEESEPMETETIIQTQEEVDQSHTFSNADISVSYPLEFFRFNQIWPDLGDYIQHNPEYETDEILNTGDGKPGSKNGYSFRIAIMQRPYSSDMDMEQVYQDAYKVVRDNYPDQEFIREDTILAGKDAVQFTLQRPSGEPWWRLRDIWVVHNQSIYIFTYWAYPSHFEDGLHYFEETIASVRFIN